MQESSKWSASDIVIWLPLFLALGIAWWQMPSSDLANLLFVATVEVLLFYLWLRLLTTHVPQKLQRSSESNCHRADGSLSAGRQRLELKARRRLQRDYLASLSAVFLAANVGAFLIGGILFSSWFEIEFETRCYIVATASVLTAIFIWQWLLFSIRRSLQEFADGIRRRSREFAIRDLSRIEDHSHADPHHTSARRAGSGRSVPDHW